MLWTVEIIDHKGNARTVRRGEFSTEVPYNQRPFAYRLERAGHSGYLRALVSAAPEWERDDVLLWAAEQLRAWKETRREKPGRIEHVVRREIKIGKLASDAVRNGLGIPRSKTPERNHDHE